MEVKMKENGFAEQDKDGRITIEFEGNERSILTSKPLPEGDSLTANLKGFRFEQQIDIDPDNFNLNQLMRFILESQKRIMHTLIMISIHVGKTDEDKESWDVGRILESGGKLTKVLKNIENNPIFKENKNV